VLDSEPPALFGVALSQGHECRPTREACDVDHVPALDPSRLDLSPKQAQCRYPVHGPRSSRALELSASWRG